MERNSTAALLGALAVVGAMQAQSEPKLQRRSWRSSHMANSGKRNKLIDREGRDKKRKAAKRARRRNR